MRPRFIPKKELPYWLLVLYYLYTGWCAILLITGFFAVLPLYWVCWQKKSWHRYALIPNKLWGYWFFILSFTRVRVLGKKHLEKGKRYIFCPNHTSYMDTPVMTYCLPRFTKFVGFSGLNSIPIFGWYFQKLHIPVDRSNARDRLAAYQNSKQTLEDGLDVLIFAEGGIFTQDPYQMTPFKEGAFRLAIETNTPIVPVTLLGTYYMLAGEEFMLRPARQTVIFHPPIDPIGHTVQSLKQFVFEQIQGELDKAKHQ